MQGDAGSPLVADSQLIGLVSWGATCGYQECYGVYLNIPAVKPFLDSYIC